MKTFGERLAQVRKQHGISQEELGDMLKVSRHIVSKWETDRGKPSVDNLAVICNFFHISANYFWEDAPDDEQGDEQHEMEAAAPEQPDPPPECSTGKHCTAAVALERFLPLWERRVHNLQLQVYRIAYEQKCMAVFALAALTLVIGVLSLCGGTASFVIGSSLFHVGPLGARIVLPAQIGTSDFAILVILSAVFFAVAACLAQVTYRRNQERISYKRQLEELGELQPRTAPVELGMREQRKAEE